MPRPGFTRADDELIIAWLVLSEAGFPIDLLAAFAGASRGCLASTIAAVRREDLAAHRPVLKALP